MRCSPPALPPGEPAETVKRTVRDSSSRENRTDARCGCARQPGGSSRATSAAAASGAVLVTVTRTSRGLPPPAGATRDLRRHRHGEARRDVQFHPFLAGEDVAGVAVLHGAFDGHAGCAQLDVDRCPERRRPERRAEGRLRVEGVAVRAVDVAPVNVRRRRAGRDAQLALAAVHPAGRQRLGAAGRLRGVEPGQPDAAHPHAAGAVIRGQHRHVQRLARRHQPVVRQHLEPQGVREQGGPLELPLLRLQALVDRLRCAGRERHAAERRAQAAHRLQPRNQRRAGAGHAGRLELPERGARLARQRPQPAGQGVGQTGAGQPRKAFDRGVDTVEQGGLNGGPRPRQRRVRQAELRAGRGGGQRDQLRHPLALVHAPRPAADLGVRAAEQRVVAAEIDGRQRRVRVHAGPETGRPDPDAERKTGLEVELRRLPGPQAGGCLLRKTRWIGGGGERLARQDRRRLMVLPAVLPPPGSSRRSRPGARCG